MSVRTTADERIDQAKEHLAEALTAIEGAESNLRDIVVDRCWGYDEFNEEYTEKLKATYKFLLGLRADLLDRL